jgi:hypothetical protein
MAQDDGCPADDRRFYKYMSRATGRVVLENRTLRWSTPATLNDPFDNQFDLHVDIDRNVVKPMTMQRLWEGYAGEHPAPIGNVLGVGLRILRDRVRGLTREQFEQHFSDVVDEGLDRGDRLLPELQDQLRPHAAQHKLLCLSTTATSTLMWAYYAEQHQGVVASFKSVPGVDSPWPAGRPVQYQPDVPRLFDANFLADMMSGRASMNVETIMERLVFTKSAEWEHEQEWRIWTGVGRNAAATYEDIRFNALELDYLIVGCRMPQADRVAFGRLLGQHYPHAAIWEVARREREFDLEVRPLLLAA